MTVGELYGSRSSLALPEYLSYGVFLSMSEGKTQKSSVLFIIIHVWYFVGACICRISVLTESEYMFLQLKVLNY